MEGLSWPLAGLHSHGLGSNSSQVRHLYICDFHKNFIQSVRNKRKRKTSDDGGDSPEQDVDVPEVGVESNSGPSCCGPARPCVVLITAQIHLGWRFLPGFLRREFLAGVSSHPGQVFEDICLPSALVPSLSSEPTGRAHSSWPALTTRGSHLPATPQHPGEEPGSGHTGQHSCTSTDCGCTGAPLSSALSPAGGPVSAAGEHSSAL